LRYKDSDKELEEMNKPVEPCMHSYSSSNCEDNIKKTTVTFHVRRTGNVPNVSDFSGPPNGINQSAVSNIHAKSSSSSRFFSDYTR
jgi:hypothetical protein